MERPPDHRPPPKRKRRSPGQGSDAVENSINRDSYTTPETFAQLSRLRRQRAAARLRRLGARVLFELLDEIARHHPGIAADLDRRLAQFADLDPGVLAALGADRFAPPPMRLVGGGGR